MRKNVLLAGLGIAGIALAVIILAGLAVKDGNPPEITFKEDTIVYRDGDDPDVLLEAVTATDKEDGDVTDSLIVKNLYEVSEKYGIVVFAAKDSSNNVTVVSRGFTYDKDVETSVQPEGGTDVQQPQQDPPEEGEDPNKGDTPKGNSGQTAGSGGTVGNTEPSDDTPEEGTKKPGTPGENTGETDGNNKSTDYDKLKDTNTSAGIPYLKLSQHEVTLKKGGSFVVQQYIEEALEGKNGTGKDAMRHIHVDDSPNMSKAGSYDVTVYIRDTSGNVSNKEIIKVTVE